MHYIFALATAFLASVVAANPSNLEERGYAYKYTTTTVYKRPSHHYQTKTVTSKPHYYYWGKNHGRPQRYGYKSYKPHHGHKHSKPYYYYYHREWPTEDEPTEEAPTEDEPTYDSDEEPTYGSKPKKPTKKPYKRPSKKPYKRPSKKPSRGPSSFADECLKAHNDKRAAHGAGPLEWDEDMASHAEQVCSKCVFAHSQDSDYGENLAAGYDSPSAAIEAWYDEHAQYDYGSGGFSSATGHFTQIVWASAKKVGCYEYECNGANGTPGKFFTCNYDNGNVMGQFEDNVYPPK